MRAVGFGQTGIVCIVSGLLERIGDLIVAKVDHLIGRADQPLDPESRDIGVVLTARVTLDQPDLVAGDVAHITAGA